jgi:uncharacterized protein DUF3995
VAAYAACGWALLFAAANIYWGLGGELAIPIAYPDTALANPALAAGNWLAGVLKAGLGLIALATAQSWGQLIPHRLLLISAYATGICMALYGALGLIVDGLRLVGVFAVPPSALMSLRWHVFVWDPWWIIGGVLFVLVARSAHGRELGG